MSKTEDLDRRIAEIDEAILVAKRGLQKVSLKTRRAELVKQREKLMAKGAKA